ncbi:bifunctional 2-C-methyl-D-erythritol 4-phosphate cytidylyltransferase/2-C-methyl-D-erythritol 2,4-cyclodiphosphate synthase [Rhodoligotrophos defluvii]|uniref:bifunctional 2-C-methyl-D-erythritol 4-phosphate cytidylyltransferase/2-C-methyl-D-erythritol 2,4-cyclodiphosphate synthase n=1 Tax=Rhodoligotrophos defluvii TaxID=2561934 RepID=UPI0010C9CDDD|nr:bifunctional 2-C-methyl-D-erythritol 4-phosphate cytidylyltransferase/2-C-methyl-D-erythritol 2,4-cyclodiphosphate synthase [Rhodoligotrophos defluvii]
MTTAALIVAAGSGVRAGGPLPKQYQTIGGQPVLRRTVEAFLHHPEVDHVQVVIGPDHHALCAEALAGLNLLPPVAGAATRQGSVFNGLQALEPLAPQAVLIHDGARPFVSTTLISTVIGALRQHDAAIPAVPIAETIKRVSETRTIAATVDRQGLWGAQTPQAFRFDTIFELHKRAADGNLTDFTDDASLAEWAEVPVAVVEGERQNVKLTTSDDIEMADTRLRQAEWAALADIRVGQGFDVHQFGPGEHVTLCGVRIPHTHGLVGHSDADVAMHALTDAIFGAIGEGDIGVHFPPSDPQWKGAASAVFLKEAVRKVHALGGIIAHCDITMVSEAPRIKPHVPAMKAELAPVLGVTEDRVAIKATTNEQMGFIGRREGMVAYATATVRLPLR